jgi:predicted SprT family Zn-dependent metalloprotease
MKTAARTVKVKAKVPPADPTRQEYGSFAAAFDYFNRELFNGTLPHCYITLQRKAGTRGYYSHERFQHRSADARTDEIALNPATFDGRDDADILADLVHEQVHLWQFHHGKPGRDRYHNREWADKMESLGLMPSDTGKPGGQRTGQHMMHYILDGGLFDEACQGLLTTGFQLNWQDHTHPDHRGKGKGKGKGGDPSKVKYTCPQCGENVWGKSGLSDVCGDCGVPRVAADGNQGACPAVKTAGTVNPSAWRSVVKPWFADLARRYHPDKAQDDGKAMSVVNDANERLLALLAKA